MELKYFFVNGTGTFINVPANLLSNDPKNPPDWIISEMWVLESLILVDILLLSAFLNFVFCLVVSNNLWGRSFPSSIFKLIIKVVPALFVTVVLVFSVAYLLILRLVYRIQSFICSYDTFVVPLENCKVVSFDCSGM